jgi:hypothetical protein
VNPEIVSELRARLLSGPRPLEELHRAAVAAGTSWSADQVALLLACLPGMSEQDGLWRLQASTAIDPLTTALLAVASTSPVPAAALLARLPRGLLASAAALCEIARRHPDLELLSGNRIRRR